MSIQLGGQINTQHGGRIVHAITDDLPRFEEHAPRDQRLRRPDGS